MLANKKKQVLYLHTQPEHYFNLMIDDLNAASKDIFYQAAFLSKGHGWYKDLPVPKSCEPIFLRIRPGMEKYAQAGFRKAHVNWQEDIQLEQFDAVIIAGYSGVTQREVIRKCHRIGVPLAVMSDSNIRSDRGSTLKVKLKRCLKKAFLASVVKKADILLPTNSLGVAYWRYYGAPQKKISIAAYYADYRRIEDAKLTERSVVYRQFHLPIDTTLLFSAARLVPAKGLELMIQAFRELNLGQKGFTYAIAGVGPLEKDLMRLAGAELNKSIFFLGFVQPNDLMKLMVHSALFVLPSKYEPHGIVIGEAAAAGTPVLASSICGCAKDVINEGVNGWVFDSGSADAIVRKLQLIVSEPSKLAGMRSQTYFMWSQWFQKTNPVKVIPSLFAQRNKSRD